MKYIIITTNTKTNERKAFRISAENTEQAMEKHLKKHIVTNDTKSKVYFDIVSESQNNEHIYYEVALMIVRSALKKVKCHIASTSPNYNNFINNLYSGSIACTMSALDNGNQFFFHHDVLDIIQECSTAMVATASETNNPYDIYMSGYKAVHSLIYANRKKLSNELWIEDENGNEVNIKKEIHYILKECDNIYLDSFETSDNDDIINDDVLQLVIADIMQDLTETQKQIVKLMSYGLSQRQIATKLDRHLKTIQEHIQAIRKKALAKYPDGMKSLF